MSDKIYVICDGVKTCINKECLHYKPHLVPKSFNRHCIGHCGARPSECISIKQIRKHKLLKINEL